MVEARQNWEEIRGTGSRRRRSGRQRRQKSDKGNIVWVCLQDISFLPNLSFLIDSGSSHSCVTTKLIDSLFEISAVSKPLHVPTSQHRTGKAREHGNRHGGLQPCCQRRSVTLGPNVQHHDARSDLHPVINPVWVEAEGGAMALSQPRLSAWMWTPTVWTPCTDPPSPLPATRWEYMQYPNRLGTEQV
jgi:hypothetical protein